jgi:formylmethanofuran dehydrogenase subunit E
MMHLEEADKLNQYLFKINPSIFRGLLLLHAQQLNRVPTWIRKDKVKKDKLDSLLDTYYEKTSSALEMSKKEFDEYAPILKMHISNKDNMKTLLMEMQADEQMFKKQKIELTMPDKTRIERSKKSHQCNSLDYFF